MIEQVARKLADSANALSSAMSVACGRMAGMTSTNPFAVVWSQLKKAGLQLYLVPFVVALVYFLILTVARTLGFDPMTFDPTGVVLISVSIVVVAFGCTFRARWRPGVARWMGICTVAAWWWVALEFSTALASGRELPFTFMGGAFILGVPYAIFFHPLGRSQSMDEFRMLITDVLGKQIGGQSTTSRDEGHEPDKLLIERLDQLMEELTTLRREVAVINPTELLKCEYGTSTPVTSCECARRCFISFPCPAAVAAGLPTRSADRLDSTPRHVVQPAAPLPGHSRGRTGENPVDA